MQGTPATAGVTGFLPETGYMMAVLVTLALQILVIVLTVTISCGMACCFRKKLEKGHVQRGKWITPPLKYVLSALY